MGISTPELKDSFDELIDGLPFEEASDIDCARSPKFSLALRDHERWRKSTKEPNSNKLTAKIAINNWESFSENAREMSQRSFVTTGGTGGATLVDSGKS